MNPIDWDTFARVRAQMDAGLDRTVVLTEANIDAPTWMSEEEALLAALADDVERADFTTIEAFRAAYRITWTELTGLAMADALRAIESSSGQFPPSVSAEPASPAEIQKASGPAPRLTLEQYASLCVEIAVFPRHIEAIFQRYGLVSQSQRLTLDLTWQERLRRNSTEYGEWQRLYQHYQAYWTDPARGDGPWQS
jgi:hypothetical protein